MMFSFLSGQHQGVGGGSRGVIPWLGQSVSQIVTNIPVAQTYPESVANFYSPLESPVASDGEHENSETESMEKKLSKTRNDTPEVICIINFPVFCSFCLLNPILISSLECGCSKGQ